MKTKNRTPKQVAEIVEKTIKEIRKSRSITDDLIKKTCRKYNISEKHIRKVAGFQQQKISYWDCIYSNYEEESATERYYWCTHPKSDGHCNKDNKFNDDTDFCSLAECSKE